MFVIAPDIQFSQAILGVNPPFADCTDEELVCLVPDQVPYSGGGECGIIRSPPLQSMRIEEVFHRDSKTSRSSPGRSSKNASLTCPCKRPACRRALSRSSGMNRAYGLPAFANRIYCPACACSSKREK